MPRTLFNHRHSALLELLRQARVGQGVNQTDLAVALQLRQTDISKIERGVRNIDVIELREWVRALRLDFVEFCGELDRRIQASEALRVQTTESTRKSRKT